MLVVFKSLRRRRAPARVHQETTLVRCGDAVMRLGT